MPAIRSFIAIEITEDLLTRLVEIQEELRAQEWAKEIRWVRPEGIHLTLKFLGNVPADQIEPIGEQLRQAVAGMSPFILTAEGLGVFPTWRRPQVVWIGIGGETEALLKLQAQVEQAMATLDFEPEDRPFHPHLTLGRVNRRAGAEYRRRLGEALQSYSVPVLGELHVQEVSLMRSQLNPKGAIYTRIAAYPLAAGAQ